jgi:DNA (cytosine-5)-methyltransferase 1
MKKSIDWYHDREPAILQEDITKLSMKKILEADGLDVGEATVVSGGPPCQGFSTVGMRMIDDPRNQLIKEFVRVVREALPQMFIMENVPGLVLMAKGEIMKQICEEFANCGYDISWDILNAADYGVPQNRRRVFVFGQRVDVMNITGESRAQLYMGANPGEINHPKSFRKKYNLAGQGQSILGDHEKPNSVVEML